MAFTRYGTGDATRNIIGSYPSDVEHRIANMYVDSTTDRVMISYVDTAGGEDGVIESTPSNGRCRVINMYVDSNGRTWVSYDENSE